MVVGSSLFHFPPSLISKSETLCRYRRPSRMRSSCSIRLAPIAIVLLISVVGAACFLVDSSRGLFGVPRMSRTADRYSSPLFGEKDGDYEFALLFDCDGVILETEELHRLAYNAAFRQFELTIDGEPVEWSVEYYDMLQNTIGGGKPKMRFHFRNQTQAFPCVGSAQPPDTHEEEEALIDQLQSFKTNEYKRILESEAETRPGVLDLMDEALADDHIAVGVCSASTKEAALKTLELTLGADRVKQLDVCILGDDVSAKKPDPLIYNTARERLGIADPDRCVVIEDSLIGLQAAKAAKMKCIITYTSSTEAVDFYGYGAEAKIPNLRGNGLVTLRSIFGPLRDEGLDAEMLAGIRDPKLEPATT